jgi:site-specific recombinase XerD
MSSLAPLLEGFFTERLIRQRQVSPNTVLAYRDTFRLLLGFVHAQTGKLPCQLDLHDLDAAKIGAFLDHLEHSRSNAVATRNARLAAVHSFFRYAALRAPDQAALIQRVLAIPNKRSDRVLVSFLTRPEVDALLASPNRATWVGRRDHALLLVAVQTGLRVSELTGLRCQDVELGGGAHLRCSGKGRKERCTPLTIQTIAVLRVWLQERRGEPGDPLFSTSRGRQLSSDAVALLVAKYAKVAQQRCPTLKNKTVSPHVLRHSAAMSLLHAGVDITVIAMWLGHESIETTQVYVHADLAIKERALARTTPLGTAPGRYRPPDALLAFLEAV